MQTPLTLQLTGAQGHTPSLFPLRLVKIATLFGLVLILASTVSAQPFREDFNSDVFGSGSWSRSDESVAVDSINGWLHFFSDFSLDDSAFKVVDFPLPLVIEWRCRHNNWDDSILPKVRVYWGPAAIDGFTITYVASGPPETSGWLFRSWTGIDLKAPSSADRWRTVKAVIRADGGELYVKTDVDSAFTQIATKTWGAIPNDIVRISLSQHADWIADFDYISVSSAVEDSLYFPSVSVAPCDTGHNSQPVKVQLSRPAKGGVVTFKVPTGVTYETINTDGLLTVAWDQVQAFPHLDSGYVIVKLNNSSGLRLPNDTTTLFNIVFIANRDCPATSYIYWDTAQSAFPSRKTAFTDTVFTTFYPEFKIGRDSTEIKAIKPGDMDNSDNVDISDLSAMIDYLYISFNPSCIQQAADVTHDGLQDISDLSALIDYLYISFTALKCPL